MKGIENYIYICLEKIIIGLLFMFLICSGIKCRGSTCKFSICALLIVKIYMPFFDM